MAQSTSVVAIGCGTIGLSVAAALASRGCDVLGCDVDAEKVERLNRGQVDAAEERLSAACAQARADGRLRFATALSASPAPRAFIIAVPTPGHAGRYDARAFDTAIAALERVLGPDDLIVVRSTVPVGTTRAVARRLAARGVPAAVACCPDRSIDGASFAEMFVIPHVVSGIDPAARRRAAGLFGLLGRVVEVSSVEAAEAIKLFANVQRDVLFGLANECAAICEQLGLDMHELVEAAADGYPRHVLPRPGPVGGPCLPKDVALLLASLDAARAGAGIALAAREVNEGLVGRVAQEILKHLVSTPIRRPAVALIGVAFKGRPATAETRGSFAVALAGQLQRECPGLDLPAWDPGVPTERIEALGLRPCGSAMEAASGTNAIVFVHDHPAVASLDIAAMAAIAAPSVMLYDLTGIFRGRSGHLPAGAILRVHGVGLVTPSLERSGAGP